MMRTWRQVGPATPPAQAWLSALRRGGERGVEPVELCEQRFGFLPARFRHRGELRQVRRLERSWDEAGRSPRRYFAVRCADGTGWTLFQDLRAGTWHLVV